MRILSALTGTMVTSAFVLAGCGLPIPLPVTQAGIECVRIADDVCGRTAAKLGWGDARIIAMRLECTQLACTPTHGSVEVMIGYRDGSMEHQKLGWTQVGALADGPIGPLPMIPAIPPPS